jgi:hypothetical protein
MSLIGKLGTQLADIKLWRQDLNVAAMEPEAFQAWVVTQLRDNLAPLLEAEVRALSNELGDVHEGLNELSDVVDEIIEHEGSFLQAGVAKQFTETLMLGLELCELVTNFDPNNELSAKKLGDVMKKYQQQALVAIDEIEQIVADDNDDDDDEESDAGEGSGLHGEGEHPEGVDAGGEDETGAGGSSESAGTKKTEGGK